jgi:uncharacterized protein (TIGR02246 family)
VFVLVFSLTQFSCAKPETFDEVKVRQSIVEACAKYSVAIQQGNLAGVVDSYTVDATLVPPDGEILKGKQAIEEFLRAWAKKWREDFPPIIV